MAGLADSELKSVTEGAMTIADVFGAEVADSTKAAGTMMKNFGISGQDALDLITVGFQKGGDYSGELLDTLNEYSPQFASMGMSADQMMGVLIAGAQAGAFNMDKVGDSIKEFNIRAQDGSKTTAEGFEAIGLSAEQMGSAIAKGGEDGQKAFMATVAALASMKDPMAQNTAGTALFGTQWEDVRSKVIVAMADGVKGIGDFKGATDEAAKAMYDNNPGLALTMALREVQGAIGPALLPLADIINNTVVPAVKSLAEGFTNLSPAGQKTVLAVVGIIAIIGPALVIIGTLISVVGTIIGVFTAASGAIAGAGGVIALLTGPIGITVAAIAGIIAIGVALYKNWDTIEEKAAAFGASVSATFKGLKDSAKNAVDEIYSFFADLKLPEINIPKVKLPHFSITGGFSLSPPGVPDFGVKWYKTGGIFNSPSVIGVGEAGREAVLPIDHLSSLMADAMRIADRKSKVSNNSYGSLLHVDKLVINNDMDIQEVANKLGFYWQQTAAAKGGR